MGDPILRLDALVPERERVQIDSDLHPKGKMYELRRRSELSVFQLQTIQSLSGAASDIDAKDEAEVTPAEWALLESFQDELIRIAFVTDIEDEVLAGLDIMQKSAIIATFNSTCFGTMTPMLPEEQVEEPAPKKTARPKKKKVTGV